MTTNSKYPSDEFAGYKNNSVAYHADDGRAYLNGKPISTYGPRYGSSSFIGCGITGRGDAFFTYNGVLLPLIQSRFQGKIYPLISMRGKMNIIAIKQPLISKS